MNRYLEKGKAILKDYIEQNELPGATFSIVTKDGFDCDYIGYKALIPDKTPNSIDTIYDLASLSKVVVTTNLVLKLLEEGKISLRMKVCDILKDFPHKNVTIRNLLTHTSGLPADDKNYKNCKNQDELWQFILKLPLKYETGTMVEYSCFGYIVLQKIVEHFKGDFEKCAIKELFEPLGMKNTMYNPAGKNRKQDCAPTEVTDLRGVIQGEVHDGKAYISGGVAGNAGVFSDIHDVSRLVQMILNDGQLDGKRILNKATINLLKKPYTANMNSTRTLGWVYSDPNTNGGDYYSEVSLFHSGFTGTGIYIDFIRKIGIVLLDNGIHPKRDSKKIEIRDKFFNQVILAYDEEN